MIAEGGENGGLVLRLTGDEARILATVNAQNMFEIKLTAVLFALIQGAVIRGLEPGRTVAVHGDPRDLEGG